NHQALSQFLSDAPRLRVLPAPMNRLRSCHYCLSVVLDDDLTLLRPEILKALAERGIGASVYYPQPVPRMTYYKKKYGYDASRFPHAARISDASIALPVGPHLDTNDMNEIASNLKDIIKGVNK
ncbi:MAG: DegT/DnrJ/EryC1/StrS family aminotransferase, partial [Chloroflexota bacterium]